MEASYLDRINTIDTIDTIKNRLIEASAGIEDPNIWKNNLRQTIFEFIQLNNLPKWPLSSALENFIDNTVVENCWPLSMYEMYLNTNLRVLKSAYKYSYKVMKLLLKFFSFFDTIIDKFEMGQYKNEVLNKEISIFIESAKDKHTFLQLSPQDIESFYYNIKHDDIFIIYFAYFCLKNNSTIILDQFHELSNSLTKILIAYLVQWFSNFIYFENLKDEKKAYIKANLLRIINLSNLTNLLFVETFMNTELKRLSDEDIQIFQTIINTKACKKAFHLFVQDTLRIGNAPFKSYDEGMHMLDYAFDHIIKNTTNFYGILPDLKHACSTFEFIFISSSYEFDYGDNLNKAKKLLCLLHEVCHIYKRIYPGKNITTKSPSSQIWIGGKLQENAEDGYRFENFLLPQPFTSLYASSAKFLLFEKSWNTDLEEFKINFDMISNQAQSKGEIAHSFSRGNGHYIGDYCLNRSIQFSK